MAALGVTGEDVTRVLQGNNYLAGVGRIKGNLVQVDLSVTTDVEPGGGTSSA